MTYRPELGELLDAVRMHIEKSLLPVIRGDQRLYFQTLVSLNLLKISQRELASGAKALREEWNGLDQLLGKIEPLQERDSQLEDAVEDRYRDLRDAIRSGEFDSKEAARRLAVYVESMVSSQLLINNPALAGRLREEIVTGITPE